MAIKKIISIKNVGRLVNCAAKGEQLKRYNLFFAENGRGKTTVCAVLRSLQTGEPGYLLERKTLGQRGEPEVQILTEGGTASFRDGKWNMTIPEVAIFDSVFVAENVHAGEYVDREHRRNLLQICVGAAGVALAKEVDRLDGAIREKNAAVADAKKAVQRHLPKGMDADAFLELQNDPEMDRKIADKTKELNAAKRASEIQTRQLLNMISAPNFPTNFDEVLGKTLDDVSSDVERRVRDHVARHEMHTRGERWLAEGLEYVRDESCPFCGQSIKGLELVETYGKFFKQAYRDLQTEIGRLRSATESLLGEAAREKLKAAIASNVGAMEFWGNFINISVVEPDFDKEILEPIAALHKAALALIDQKLAAPLEKVSEGEGLRAAKASYVKLVERLTIYGAVVEKVNKPIQSLKDRAKGADPIAIEKQIAGLVLVKSRHEAQPKTDCDMYEKAAGEKKKLDDDKVEAKKKLDDHAEKMIREYEVTINSLLTGFGAGFRLTNAAHTYVGGTPASTYQLLVNETPVDIGDAATPLGTPSFKTTMSAGDKSTLALAVFLAYLGHDPNQSKRIVIFDDPFNSQDRSRRERTAELLKKYGQECGQLFLLSHDPYFLKLVSDKLPKAETRAQQLSRVGKTQTTIEDWDVEKETQDGYFKDHAALSSYRLHGAKELIDIARKIRPVLEGYCRYRFPNQFPDKEWLGDIVGRVRDTVGTATPHPLVAVLEELEAINDYSKKYHHDTNPGSADSEPLSDGELETYTQRTLVIVGGY